MPSMYLELSHRKLAATPEDLVTERLIGAAFPGTLGRPVLGRPATIERLTGARLRAFQLAHYIAPRIVIATPGAEPRVLPASRQSEQDAGEYRAVTILDAWNSLYAPGVDARVDALTAWMRVMALCAPRTRGGQGLLIGECDPAVAHALMMWDSASLARNELLERGQAGMPPVCAVACVWGRRDAVMAALDDIGVLRGDWASLDVAGEPIPGMLGPVPIAAPVTVSERELESMQDRVKALVRVPVGMRAQLAVRLRSAVARHMASRTPGELRFQIDPKDLI